MDWAAFPGQSWPTPSRSRLFDGPMATCRLKTTDSSAMGRLTPLGRWNSDNRRFAVRMHALFAERMSMRWRSTCRDWLSRRGLSGARLGLIPHRKILFEVRSTIAAPYHCLELDIRVGPCALFS